MSLPTVSLIKGYIGKDEPALDSCYNHIALEAAIRAVEDDCCITPYHLTQCIDLRLYEHLESISDLRDLIRKPEFCLDLIKVPQLVSGGAVYKTPYGRAVEKGWVDNHRIIHTSKGRLVLDVFVPVEHHIDPGA
ncbi:hypothetical protein D3C85_13960 [compost metagenome]